MAKRKDDTPAPGAPAWMATFGDLMNLLLCFYVLLFSMSTINKEKWDEVAQSFTQSFSIFSGGATSIGEGILISNGVSQLNELDQYINSTGKMVDGDGDALGSNGDDAGTNGDDEGLIGDDKGLNEYEKAAEVVEQTQLEKSEELAEKIGESLEEGNLTGTISIDVTAQYVQLTLRGALLFDSGRAEIRSDALPVLDKVGIILETYAGGIIEIEGHTDNVPVTGNRFADNSELSCARALSAFNYFLETTNLEPASIKYAGRGEYVPIADNSTEAGRARNRRIEIRIYHDYSSYQ